MASILVIDDERHIRDLLRKVLEGAGHTVKEASNGRDAMRIWRESPVDLIITDILMPEQDGLEFIRELRRGRLQRRSSRFPAAVKESTLIH